MKTRIISGAVLVVVMIAVFCGIYTPVFSIFFALLSALAAYEIMGVAKVESKLIKYFSMAFAAFVPLYFDFLQAYIPFTAIAMLFVLVLLAIMLADYKDIKFEHIAIAAYSAIFIPVCFSTFILTRDIYKLCPDRLTGMNALFLVLIGVSCSWLTDTCAYFVGVKFGKHKMTPVISPKKSVEGAVGGLVGCLVLNLIILYLFNTYIFEKPFIGYGAFVPISLVLSAVSMVGDLVASVIKRNYGAKDYGSLIPGHGGIMDRFDSCLFVMPTLYLLITLIYTV